MLATRSSRSWPLGLVLVLGCSALSDRASDDARPDPRPVQDGGRAGTGSVPHVDQDAAVPVPTTITVENDGSAPIVLGNLCGGRFLGLSHEGDELAYDRSCANECGSDVGGCPAICLFTQELLVPGEEASFDWDGLFASFEGHPECYELSSLPSGDEVSATACWNETPEGELVDCTSVGFAYDEERDVTISVKHDSEARIPTKISFKNLTGGPIGIGITSCGQQDWFQLALPLDEGRSVSLTSSCPCSCDADFEVTVCPDCETCSVPTIETVPAGETRSFEWDGMFWYNYPSGCSAQYAMPASFLVPGEICFTRQSTGVRSCQPVSFVLGENAEISTAVL
jgi:hypothetical protein